MLAKYTSPRILFPRTIGQALEYYSAEKDAVFWAGGTRLASETSRNRNRIQLPKVVIALTLVEELARASRTENSLELGSMMSLDRLSSVGRKSLPPGLGSVLASIGTRPLRCRATLGGNIACGGSSAPGRRGDLLPLLQLLDTKVEIRYMRERKGRRKPAPTVRKVPLAVLEEEKGLRPGDLITRISIPTDTWNYALTEKLPAAEKSSPEFIFQAVARVEKSTLVDWRMALWDGFGTILRDRDVENALAGSPLPLARRSLEILDESVSSLTRDWKDRKTDRETALCMARSFMKQAAG